MFTPKMPSLFVLVGDQACGETEHLVSAMVEHADKDYFPLLQVVCFPDSENTFTTITSEQINITVYPLEQLKNGGFSSVISQVRGKISEKISNAATLHVRYSDIYIAFVCKGTQIEAETVISFRQEAQKYLDALNCTLITQLCYLTEEDDPVHYSSQSNWLRDPMDTNKPKEGLLAFDRMLILSTSNSNRLHNYQTKLQMESAFPLGLLSVRHAMEYATKAYSMRFGKINGSTYDMRRLLKNTIAASLEEWASREVDAQDGWKMLSTNSVNITNVNSDTDSLIQTLSNGLSRDLPLPEDLAFIGLSDPDYSPEDIIFSFDDINGNHITTETNSSTWGEQWYSDILLHLEENPRMEGLVRLLEDDGVIGSTIRNAYIEIDERLRAITDVKAWLMQQWSYVSVSSGMGLFKKQESRNLKTLEAYYPAYKRLCEIRGVHLRLNAMNKQRIRLIGVMKNRILHRQNFLKAFRLPEDEYNVLYSLCTRYAVALAESVKKQDPSQLNCYYAVSKTLYHETKLEESWLKLYEGMMARTEQTLQTLAAFGEAFAMGLGAIELSEKIREHPYNDATLIPQLPQEMPNETPRSYFLVPQAVYNNLNPQREAEGFICIPGDVIERVSYVSLGSIEGLLTLRMFKPYDIAELQPISAIDPRINTPETNVAQEVQEPQNTWNVRLIKGSAEWGLSWKWVGDRSSLTKITWNGEEPIMLTHKKWVENGEMVPLNAENIPYGRFDITLQCDNETTSIRIAGKPISLKMVYHKKHGKALQTADEITLEPIAFHLEGPDLAVAREHHILLRKTNGDAVLDYDFFSSFSLEEASTQCIVYCEPDASITFVGRDDMTGLVQVQVSGRNETW